MENEDRGVRAAEHRPLCLCILAIGALFACGTSTTTTDFFSCRTISTKLRRCLAYGGALGAFPSSSGPGELATARASLAHRPRHCPSAHWYVALHRRYGRLARWRHRRPAFFIGTAFFSQLFFLMRWLCTSRPPYRRSHCGSYSDLRRSGKRPHGL